MKNFGNFRIYIFLFLLSILFYGNSLFNGHNLDDSTITTSNPLVRKGIAAIPEIFTSPYFSDGHNTFGYRPMTKASFALEYSLWGENLFLSHLVNLLVYALACCILYRTLLLLFSEYGQIYSLLVCILFLAHPIHTEVVCSLKNREVLFSFTGAITAFYFYLRFAQSGKWLVLLPALISLAFAAFSKEDAAVYLVIIPFSLYYFRKIEWKKLLVVVASLVVLVLLLKLLASGALLVRRETRIFLYYENPLLFDPDKSHFISMTFSTLAHYIRLLFLPYPLISYYGYNAFPIPGIYNYKTIVSALLVAVSVVFSILQFRKRTLIGFSILFFFLAISLFTNSFFPVAGIVGDRLAFNASLGFCIFTIALLYRLFKLDPATSNSFQPLFFFSKNQGVRNSTILVLIVFWGLTFSRNFEWKDILTLTGRDVEKAPESLMLNTLLGGALLDKSNSPQTDPAQKNALTDQAVIHYTRALSLYPRLPVVLNNLGMIEALDYANFDQALAYFLKAIEAEKGHAEYYLNAASTYVRLNRNNEAVDFFRQAIETDSTYGKAYLALSDALVSQGRLDDAISLHRLAIRRGVYAREYPTFTKLGDLYLMKKDTALAVEAYGQAVLINPSNKGLLHKIIRYYLNRGEPEKAAPFLKLQK